MTDLRKAAQQALEALETKWYQAAAIAVAAAALREALAESEPPKTPWAHLPNAAHIDRVIAQLAAHPDTWDEARVASWYAVQDASWYETRGIALDKAIAQALDKARHEVWDATWVAVRGVARASTRDAIAALLAWDDAGELLSLPIEAVRAMADEGDHAAILIYPAMLAMKEEDK